MNLSWKSKCLIQSFLKSTLNPIKLDNDGKVCYTFSRKEKLLCLVKLVRKNPLRIKHLLREPLLAAIRCLILLPAAKSEARN
jgi:hypothetical protein